MSKERRQMEKKRGKIGGWGREREREREMCLLPQWNTPQFATQNTPKT